MVYIKGWFRPTAAAAAKLDALRIENPAGEACMIDNLWGSVFVPEGVFIHTPGRRVPGRLDLVACAAEA